MLVPQAWVHAAVPSLDDVSSLLQALPGSPFMHKHQRKATALLAPAAVGQSNAGTLAVGVSIVGVSMVGVLISGSLIAGAGIAGAGAAFSVSLAKHESCCCAMRQYQPTSVRTHAMLAFAFGFSTK